MALFNILSSVIVGLVSLFTVPIFSRMLEQGDYGLTGVYTAWVQIFSVIIGLQVSGSIGSAYANLKESEQDSYQLSVLVLALLSFGTTMILVFFFLAPLSDALEMSSSMVICAVVQSFGTSVIGVFNKRYVFKKQAQANLLLSVAVSVSSSVLAMILVVIRPGGIAPYLAWALGFAIPPTLIGLFVSIQLALKAKAVIRARYWAFCLRITLPIILHGLSGVVLAQMGRIGIQHEYGDAMAGVYSIAITVESVLVSLYNALKSAFVPFMYDDLAERTHHSVKMSHFRNYFVLFTGATFVYLMLGAEAVKILSPADYWGAIEVVPFLIVGAYFMFLYSFPVNYEFYAMRTASVGIGTLLAAIVNVILVVTLVPAYGMLGAAVATMVAYLFLFLFHFLIARFFLGDRNYPAFVFFGGMVAVLLMAALSCILQDHAVIRWMIALAMLVTLTYRLIKVRTIF